jgi:hypothetical protein
MYDPKNDPFLKLTKEQQEAAKKNLRIGAQRAYSVGYGIIGGAMGLVLLFAIFRNKKT